MSVLFLIEGTWVRLGFDCCGPHILRDLRRVVGGSYIILLSSTSSSHSSALHLKTSHLLDLWADLLVRLTGFFCQHTCSHAQRWTNHSMGNHRSSCQTTLEKIPIYISIYIFKASVCCERRLQALFGGKNVFYCSRGKCPVGEFTGSKYQKYTTWFMYQTSEDFGWTSQCISLSNYN